MKNYCRKILHHWISPVLLRIGVENVILTSSVVLLVFLSFREALKIDFGPIDDHEIFRFLGPDQKLNLFQVPRVLWQETEVGQWGQTTRFRPSYYLLRILETMVFETRSKLWYANRILITCVTALIFSATVIEVTATRSRAVKLSIGISAALVVLSVKSLAEITFRLGPAETYLVLAIAVFLYSSIKLIQNTSSKLFWYLNFASAIVAIGSKENGVAVIIPFLYLLGVQIKTDSLVRKVRVSQGIVLVVFACLVVIGPIKNMANVGTDIYGSQRSLRASFSFIRQFLESPSSRSNSFVLIAILLLIVVNYGATRKFLWTTKAALFLSTSLYLLLLTEFVFYQGNLGELRYQLVSDVASNLLVIILVAVSLNTFSLFLPQRELLLGFFVVSSLFLSQDIVHKYSESRKNNIVVAKSKALQTAEYQMKIKAIEEAISMESYKGIVIQLNNVWDYEFAYAISQYIAFLGNGAPVSLKISIGEVALGLETQLINQLLEYQTQGSLEWKVQPLSKLVNGGNLCVVFNGAVGDLDLCKVSLPG